MSDPYAEIMQRVMALNAELTNLGIPVTISTTPPPQEAAGLNYLKAQAQVSSIEDNQTALLYALLALTDEVKLLRQAAEATVRYYVDARHGLPPKEEP